MLEFRANAVVRATFLLFSSVQEQCTVVYIPLSNNFASIDFSHQASL